jgi:hypothetical protein
VPIQYAPILPYIRQEFGARVAKLISRREVLKELGQATAGLALTGGVLRAQGAEIVVAGKLVEIVVASVSPSTVRISMGFQNRTT